MSNYHPSFVKNVLTLEQERKWAEDAVNLKIKTEGINGKIKNPMIFYVKEVKPDNYSSIFINRINFIAIHEI